VVSTLQTIGTSVGVTVVGVLLFSVLEHGAAGYGKALAWATVYNVIAGLASLLLFTHALVLHGWRARRDSNSSPPAS